MEGLYLEDKVAIVTGASRGIGRAVALVLSRAGASVALAARSEEHLNEVHDEIAGAGGTSMIMPVDVGDEQRCVGFVRAVVETLGRLDILVNNAGIGLFGPLEETATEVWDKVMAVNARGAFILCREAIPHLRQQELSFIVNIASVVGVKGYANQSVYSASKHALMGMSKALAREVQKDNIRVHAVCPGGVDTELVGNARPDLDRSILMTPREIADIVLFLVTRRGNAVIDQIDVRRATSTPWG